MKTHERVLNVRTVKGYSRTGTIKIWTHVALCGLLTIPAVITWRSPSALNANNSSHTIELLLPAEAVPRGYLRSVAFSRDGKHVIAGSDDGRVKLWDASSGTCRNVLARASESILSLSVSPDNRIIAVGSGRSELETGELVLWDLQQQSFVRLLGTFRTPVSKVEFSSDGSTLAAVTRDGRLRTWDTCTWQGRTLFSPATEEEGISTLAFAPRGSGLLGAREDGALILGDISSLAVSDCLRGHSGHIMSCAFSPDGHCLATAGRNGNVRLWHVANGKLSPAMELDQGRYSGETRCVSFSPDGQWLATAEGVWGFPGIVRLWNPRTGAKHISLKGHVKAVHAVAFSLSGSTLATAGGDATVRLWDVASGKQLMALDFPVENHP